MGKRSQVLMAALAGLVAAGALGWLAGQALRGPTSEAQEQPGLGLRRVYSVKFVCGLQTATDIPGATLPAEPAVKPGNYATAVNVHNFHGHPIGFRKRVALSHPPGGQEPGPVGDFVTDNLGPFQALEVDCADIVKLLPGAVLPPFIKGFLEIATPRELNVVAVYTAQSCLNPPTCSQLGEVDLEVAQQRMFASPPRWPPPTIPPRGTPPGTPTPTPTATPPMLPTIVSGIATIDGTPAAGLPIVALISANDCGSTAAGSGGSYTVQVGGRAVQPAACDQVGATINFTVGGLAAPQTTTRDPGTIKTLNLTVTTATPTPTGTPGGRPGTPRPVLPPGAVR